MPTLFLIDGSSQMYRAYHAIRGLTGPDGRSTNAVYGFVAMLRKLLADHKPDAIAAAFDLEGRTFRDDLSDDYKANRAPMPPDLVEQVPLIHEACAALGVPVLTSEGFEADDVIGTLALKAAAEGYDVAIVTGDKDFFQLVGGRIRVFNPRDEGTWYDPAGVVEKFGVTPDKVIDVLALTGDAVDNVKGVPGIGDKGARDLIAQFGSLDALLEGAASVQQKRYREALLANADAARASRELVTIRPDVPVDRDARFTALPRPRPGGLLCALHEAGIPHLHERLRPDRRHRRHRLRHRRVSRQPGGRGDRGAIGRSRRPSRARRRWKRHAGPHRGRSRSRAANVTPATCPSGTAPSTR